MVHSYTIASALSRQGKCREVLYVAELVPEVKYTPNKPNVVLVSITGLAEAFFRGMDRFIIEIFGDPIRSPLAKKRLETLIHYAPIIRRA